MDEELDRRALREVLYEGFEPPSGDLTETVLASVAAAPVASALVAWLQAHWLVLVAAVTASFAVTGAGVAVVLHQQQPPPPPPPPPALAVYVGYADTVHPGGQAAPLPSPWNGSPEVTFEGSGPDFDAGAIRIDNRSSRTLTIDRVTVDIGTRRIDLWRPGLRLAAHHSLVLTQTNGMDFDTSESNPPNCQRSAAIPVVHVTVDGKSHDFRDLDRVLTSGGYDASGCGGAENHPWEQLPTEG